MLISQAMIVKNEEKNIVRALSWGKDLVFEQIIVDTGSTDNTVNIAKENGAKVYHFDWINDFSAAKNFAIEKCTGDWIAFLDADEFINDDIKKIPEIIKKAEADNAGIIAAQLINLNDEGKIIGSITQARIFKNNLGIYYRGRVHENLFSNNNIKIYDATNELVILHTGYCDTDYIEKDKNNRNRYLLEKEIEDHPDNSDYYGYLGDIYADEKDYAKAEELYFKAIKNMDESISDASLRRGITLRNLLLILGGYNYRTEELIKVYEFASNILPHDADFSCMVADHFYTYQKYEEAVEYYNKAIELYDTYGAYQKSDYVDSHLRLIYYNLACSCYMLKNYNGAIKNALVVLSFDKKDVEMLKTLLLSIKSLSEAGVPGYDLQDIISLFNKLYDFNSLQDKVFIYLISQKLNLNNITDYIKTLCSQEELKILEEV